MNTMTPKQELELIQRQSKQIRAITEEIMSETPETDEATTDGWNGDASATRPEVSQKLERERNALLVALKYWLPDETMMPPRTDAIGKQHWDKFYEHVSLIASIESTTEK